MNNFDKKMTSYFEKKPVRFSPLFTFYSLLRFSIINDNVSLSHVHIVNVTV